MEKQEGNSDEFKVSYDTETKIFKQITTMIDELEYYDYLRSIDDLKKEIVTHEKILKTYKDRLFILEGYEQKAIYLKEENKKNIDKLIKEQDEVDKNVKDKQSDISETDSSTSTNENK